MSLPKPPVSLDGGCSAIHDNTLYVYTPDAFLSIPLKKPAKWKKLSMGESVSGAACAKGPSDTFYVIGGRSNDTNYTGYQRFSFTSNKWETLQPAAGDLDLKDRQHHGAVYIEGLSQFLVYGGSRDSTTNPSTSTFLVGAEPPYSVAGHSTDGSLAASDPTLLPWDSQSAVMVGAGTDKTQVWAFRNNEWENTGATLAQPLPDKSQAQAVMLTGSDGSKILEIFDMSKKPNEVTSWILSQNGQPLSPAKQVGQSQSSNSNGNSRRNVHTKHRKLRRDISAQNFPAYNGKYAGDSTRSQFSLAQDGSQKVAISGGDDDIPVAVFDQSKNSWLDPTQVFGTTSSPSATVASSLTPTSASATSTTLPSNTDIWGNDSKGDGSSVNKGAIVGAGIGAALAMLLIQLLLILFFYFRKRNGNRAAAAAAAKQGNLNEKDRLSFQDQGLQPLRNGQEPMGTSQPTGMQSSSSLAILAGKGLIGKGQEPASNQQGSNLKNMDRASNGNQSFDSMGATDVPPQNAAGSRLTDDGWGKYFESDKPGNGGRESGMSTSTTDTKSDYHDSRLPRNLSLDLAAVKVGRVEESPVTQYQSGLEPPLSAHPGMAATFGDTDSDEEYDRRSSGRRSAGSIELRNSWNVSAVPPAEPQQAQLSHADRVTSSNYSSSFLHDTSAIDFGAANRQSVLNDQQQQQGQQQWPAVAAPRGQGGNDDSVFTPPRLNVDRPLTDASQMTTWTDIEEGMDAHGRRASGGGGGNGMQLPEMNFSSERPLTQLTAWPEDAEEGQHGQSQQQGQGQAQAQGQRAMNQDLGWLSLDNRDGRQNT